MKLFNRNKTTHTATSTPATPTVSHGRMRKVGLATAVAAATVAVFSGCTPLYGPGGQVVGWEFVGSDSETKKFDSLAVKYSATANWSTVVRTNAANTAVTSCYTYRSVGVYAIFPAPVGGKQLGPYSNSMGCSAWPIEWREGLIQTIQTTASDRVGIPNGPSFTQTYRTIVR